MRSLVMRSQDQVNTVLDLAGGGRSAFEIARLTGIPRSTIRTWIRGDVPRADRTAGQGCAQCGGSHLLDEQPPEYVYLLGLYLGDGCISAHPRAVFRLRVFFDARYPALLQAGEEAIRTVFPSNRVGHVARSGGYATSSRRSNVELSVYSQALPCLFPQHGPGRKHERRIELTDWQWSLVSKHPEHLLRGLIHSDGCRFVNTGRNWRHPRYSFSNLSDDIRSIFCRTCDLLEVRWTTAPHTVYVSRIQDVAKLDEFIGPKS